MTTVEQLRAISQDVQVTGKFGKREALAVLSQLIDMADRLEKVERVCEIQHPT